MMMYRDPPFDLAQIQTAVRHLYLDNLSRSKEAEGRIAGRGIVMSAESVVCYNCDEVGHISRNYRMPAKNTPSRAGRAARINLLDPSLDPEARAALGKSGAPFTRPRLTTTPSAISRERDAHRVTLSPLLCSTPTLLLLMTARSRPSTSTTISTGVSCGWRLLTDGHLCSTAAESRCWWTVAQQNTFSMTS